MQLQSVAPQTGKIQVINGEGIMVVEAATAPQGWLVNVPYREGRAKPGGRGMDDGRGIPSFFITSLTVPALEELLTVIAKGLGEV